jgi:hypothetical protein
MAGRRLEALTLTEAERSELTALAARPKTAQVLAQRADRPGLCRRGRRTRWSAANLVCMP